MASTSLLLSNHITGSRFSTAAPPHSPSHSLRVSAACATAERGNRRTTTTASLYEVLGIQTGATYQEIKSAYRKLARVLHPDVAASHGASAADDFMRVHAAYATLSDPEKRAVYDSSRGQKAAVLSAGGYSEAVVPRKRTWETDQCW